MSIDTHLRHTLLSHCVAIDVSTEQALILGCLGGYEAVAAERLSRPTRAEPFAD